VSPRPNSKSPKITGEKPIYLANSSIGDGIGIKAYKRAKLEWRIVLVEVALETAGPLGVGSGSGEAGEEFGDGARRC